MNVPSRTRYTPGLRHLHWLVALLVLAAYLFIEQRGLFARGTPERAAMIQAHFWTGLTILVLAVWRVALRMRATAPPITPAIPAWQAIPSKLLHLVLYAFILAMPVLGLATAWADDKTLYVPFTQIALPTLLAPNEDLGHRLEELHGQIGEIFYWVIGLHVLAALYHHLVRRDDTLRRML